MKRWLLFIGLLCFLQVHAQNKSDTATGDWQAGLELDVLPFALGGYFGASWIGKDQVRLRLLSAKVNKPDFTTNSAFTHHQLNAYALVADYFLKPGWNGWWVGAGPVYWQSTIISKSSGTQASFFNWLFNGSVGYHYRIKKRIYISPWAGLSFRFAGKKNVPVGTERYTLPLINPEVSVKFGFVL
jgi:hypothetical protein